MKLLNLILLLFTFVTFNSFAQDISNVKTFVQQKAGPHESLQEFYENFVKEFNVPKLPSNQSQLKLVVKFIVEKDGSFSNITVVDQPEEVTYEIIRVLSKMPKWKPGYHEGEPVRSSFNLPVTIRLNDYVENEENFKKDVEAYRTVLKKYEQVTDFFKFNCNCVTSTMISEPDGSGQTYQYETLDNVGTYIISFRKVTEKEQKKFFKDFIKEISKSKIDYKMFEFGNKDALSIWWIEKFEDQDFYIRSVLFLDSHYLFTLNFTSKNNMITDVIFDELLNSFQIKQ